MFTQAKRLDQVAAAVADAVSLMEGVDAESVEVAIAPQLRTEVRRGVEKALRLKRVGPSRAGGGWFELSDSEIDDGHHD